MLEIPRTLLADTTTPPRIVVAGLGNAGVALIDRLTLAGLDETFDLVAINTDSLSLGSSVATKKILIGSRTARGLGTGGDPEVGAQSAEESATELAAAVDGAGVVIVCAGLGGGVGSGAAPVLVDLARERGAFVVALATQPFGFEGRRRVQQASDAQEQLGRLADAFLIFENDRMAELSEPLAGVHETFAAADQVLAETVISLARLTATPGPVRISVADLLAVFRDAEAGALFGFAEAAGANRANEAVERAFKCPLLARGRALSDARATLVHIVAPSDLRLAEVRAVLDQIARHTEGQIHLGLGLDPDRATLGVAILAATGEAPTPAAEVPTRTRQATPAPPKPAPVPVPVTSVVAEDAPVDGAKASELFDTSPFTVAKTNGGRKAPKPEQKTLSLDPIARGRFEKSEPTIVGGEDLDVPTFLRQKIKLR